MYELNYVKKRKRRKWIAIGAGISTIVIVSLSIISFLGRFVGTFTVKLETGNVKLSLSESKEFTEPTSYLRVGEVPALQEWTYSALEAQGFATLDSEEVTFLTSPCPNYSNGTLRSLNFFKFTYYVKNVGNLAARFDMNVRIYDSKSDNGKSVDDTLRVMMLHKQNDSNPNYERYTDYDVYAKISKTHHLDDENKVSYQEKISIDPYGYATEFKSSEIIASIPGSIVPDEIQRYTVVFWLEGYDPESDPNELIPVNARLRLGVEINAYEN